MSLTEKYGIPQSRVGNILCNFAAENDKSALLMKNKPTDSQAEEIKALRKEVLKLRQSKGCAEGSDIHSRFPDQ